MKKKVLIKHETETIPKLQCDIFCFAFIIGLISLKRNYMKSLIIPHKIKNNKHVKVENFSYKFMHKKRKRRRRMKKDLN